MDSIIRPATAADTQGVVRTVKAVFDEYGFTWDADDYHADLYDVAGHYFDKGDKFFIAEDPQLGVVGTVALQLFPAIPGEVGQTGMVEGRVRVLGADCSLERLYVDPRARRRGLGEALTLKVIDEARALGRHAMEMWSDKRFGDAHRLYQRLGAEVVGERICHDPDQSPEWGLLVRLA
jgi:GNAT superfamily N-acetyltransferase